MDFTRYETISCATLPRNARRTVSDRYLSYCFGPLGSELCIYFGCESGGISQWRAFGEAHGGVLRFERRDEAFQSSKQKHLGSVTAIRYIQHERFGGGGGGLLFSGSSDRSIKVWDVNSEREEKCVQTLVDHGATVSQLLDGTDGSVISCALDCTVKVWRPERGREPTQHPFFVAVRSVELGSHWATAAAIYGGQSWHLWVGDASGSIHRFAREMSADSVSPRDASASSGLQHEQELQRPLTKVGTWQRVHSLGVAELKMVAAAHLLLSRGFDCTVRVLDSGSGQALLRIEHPDGIGYTGMAWARLGHGPSARQEARDAAQKGAAARDVDARSHRRRESEAPEVLLCVDGLGNIEAWSVYADRRLARRRMVPRRDPKHEALKMLCAWPGACRRLLVLEPQHGVASVWHMSADVDCRPLKAHGDAVVALALLLRPAAGGDESAGAEAKDKLDAEDFGPKPSSAEWWRQRLSDMKRGGSSDADEKDTSGRRKTEDMTRRSTLWGAASAGAMDALPLGSKAGAEGSGHALQLYSCGIDGTVMCWDAHGESCDFDWKHRGSEMCCLLAASALGLLCSGHEDGAVRLWAPESGSGHCLRRHTNSVTCLCLARPRRGELLLASSGYDGRICVWNLSAVSDFGRHGVLEEVQDGAHDADAPEVLACAYHEASGLLCTGGNDASVRLWTLPRLKPAGRLRDRGEPVVCLAAFGHLLLSALESGAVVGYRVSADAPPAKAFRFHAHEASVKDMAVTPGAALLATCAMDGFVRLWDLASVATDATDAAYADAAAAFASSDSDSDSDSDCLSDDDDIDDGGGCSDDESDGCSGEDSQATLMPAPAPRLCRELRNRSFQPRSLCLKEREDGDLQVIAGTQQGEVLVFHVARETVRAPQRAGENAAAAGRAAGGAGPRRHGMMLTDVGDA